MKDLETRFLALEGRLEALEEKNAAGWARLFGGKVREQTGVENHSKAGGGDGGPLTRFTQFCVCSL